MAEGVNLLEDKLDVDADLASNLTKSPSILFPSPLLPSPPLSPPPPLLHPRVPAACYSAQQEPQEVGKRSMSVGWFFACQVWVLMSENNEHCLCTCCVLEG